ncbi:MBL fold metallo-hydrolase [Thalassovita sp.]|uniref:MBL fold metallo-hydrolase n=1 Tax=Thalassovita sp. TaxID=1979401 RepID=UPI003B5B1E25
MKKATIITIPIVPLGILNAFLVIENGRALLVDTGVPGSAPKIEKALGSHGLGWTDVALTVVTHAHIDHAGSGAKIQRLSHGPILAHKLEQPYCEGRKHELFPTSLTAHLFRKTGTPDTRIRQFTPDILQDGDLLDLSEFGFSAQTVFTPGHTPGSISVLLNDKRVLAGDLLASGILIGGIIRRNHPIRPPFEEDPKQVAASLEHLLSLGARKFHIGHGGPLSAEKVKTHIEKLRKL